MERRSNLSKLLLNTKRKLIFNQDDYLNISLKLQSLTVVLDSAWNYTFQTSFVWRKTTLPFTTVIKNERPFYGLNLRRSGGQQLIFVVADETRISVKRRFSSNRIGPLRGMGNLNPLVVGVQLDFNLLCGWSGRRPRVVVWWSKLRFVCRSSRLSSAVVRRWWNRLLLSINDRVQSAPFFPYGCLSVLVFSVCCFQFSCSSPVPPICRRPHPLPIVNAESDFQTSGFGLPWAFDAMFSFPSLTDSIVDPNFADHMTIVIIIRLSTPKMSLRAFFWLTLFEPIKKSAPSFPKENGV